MCTQPTSSASTATENVVIRPEELALVISLCRELAEHDSLIRKAISQGVDLKDLDVNSTTRAENTATSARTENEH